VPADFALVLDENVDTYYARQHVHQVVTASDMMSRTTYTTFRDYNNTVADEYTHETPLTAAQVQGMWNDVRQNNLMRGGWVWRNWTTNASNFRSDQQTLEIRAAGQQVAYKQNNYWAGSLQDLVLQVEGARFGLHGRNTAGPVEPAAAPAVEPETPGVAVTTSPAAAVPATETQPASAPAGTEPTSPAPAE
jgi:hypothetical protein